MIVLGYTERNSKISERNHAWYQMWSFVFLLNDKLWHHFIVRAPLSKCPCKKELLNVPEGIEKCSPRLGTNTILYKYGIVRKKYFTFQNTAASSNVQDNCKWLSQIYFFVAFVFFLSN